MFDLRDPLFRDAGALVARLRAAGHAALLAKALESAPRVIVLLGSAFAARNAKNPFSWDERAAMIGCTLDEAQRARVDFVPMRDYYNDVRWAATAARCSRPTSTW